MLSTRTYFSLYSKQTKTSILLSVLVTIWLGATGASSGESSENSLGKTETAKSTEWRLSGVLDNVRLGSNMLFSADGTKILYVDVNNEIVSLNITTGICLNPVDCYQDGIHGIALSNKGNILAGAHAKGVNIWDVENRTQMPSIDFKAIDQFGYGVAFAHQDTLFTVSGNPAIVWSNPTSPEPVRKSKKGVLQYAFTPDGKYQIEREYLQVIIRERASERILHTLPIRRANVCIVSPDGRLLAEEGHERVTIWEIATGKKLSELPVESERINTICFSPGSQLLATAGEGAIRMWNLSTGTLHARIFASETKYDMYSGVVFSPDGRWLAAYAGGDILVWGEPGHVAFTKPDVVEHSAFDTEYFPKPFDEISSATLVNGGKTIAMGSRERGLWLVDSKTRTVIGGVGKLNSVRDMVVSRDGRYLAVSDRYQVRVYDILTRIELIAVQPPDEKRKSRVAALAISADGENVFVAWEDGPVEVISVTNTKPRRQVTELTGTIADLCVSPSDKHLVAIQYKQEFNSHRRKRKVTPKDVHLIVVKLDDLTIQSSLPQSKIVSRLAFSGNEGLLAVANRNTVFVWNIITGKRIGIFRESRQGIMDFSISPDGKRLALSLYNGPIQLYRLVDGVCTDRLLRNPIDSDSLLWSKDDRTLFSARGNRIVKWTLDGKEENKPQEPAFVNQPPGQPKIVPLLRTRISSGGRKYVVSPNGDIVMLYLSHRMSFFDTRNGRRIDTHIQNNNNPAHSPTAITSATFLANGKSVLVGTDEGTLHLWDIEGRKQVHQWQAHANGKHITSVVISKNSKTVVTSCSDGSVMSWSLSENKARLERLRTLLLDASQHCAIAVSPNGNQIATSPDVSNAGIRIWNSISGELSATLATNSTFQGKAYRVLAFSPNGKTLAAISDKAVEIFDISNRTLIATIAIDYAKTLVFSSDGSMLFLPVDDDKTGSESIAAYDSATFRRLWAVEVGRHSPCLLATNSNDSALIAIASYSQRGVTEARRFPLSKLDADAADLEHTPITILSPFQEIKVGANYGIDRVGYSNNGDWIFTKEIHSSYVGIRNINTNQQINWGCKSNVFAESPVNSVPQMENAISSSFISCYPFVQEPFRGRSMLYTSLMIDKLSPKISFTPHSQMHKSRIENLFTEPRNNLLVSRSTDGVVKLWDTREHTHILTLPERATSIAVHPISNHIVTGTQRGDLFLWKTNGEKSKNIFGPKGKVHKIIISSSGKYLATYGTAGLVVRNLQKEFLLPIRGPKGFIQAFAFSTDERYLIVAHGSLIELWEIETGRLTNILKGHEGHVLDLAVSKETGQLASSGQDGKVILWNLR